MKAHVKVVIEHGGANHLANEMSSVAYWYQDEPQAAVAPPPIQQRLPVLRDNEGHWLHDPQRQCPGQPVEPTAEMRQARAEWQERSTGR